MVTNGDNGAIGANDDPFETMMIHWWYNGPDGDNGSDGDNCDNNFNGDSGNIGANGDKNDP